MINFTFVEFLNLIRVFVNSSLISGSKDKCPLSVNTFKKDFNVNTAADYFIILNLVVPAKIKLASNAKIN